MHKKDDRLSYLLIGATSIAFYAFAMPMMDSVSVWFQNIFREKSYRLQAESEEYKEKIESKKAKDDENAYMKTNCVGFDTSMGAEEEEEYYE